MRKPISLRTTKTDRMNTQGLHQSSLVNFVGFYVPCLKLSKPFYTNCTLSVLRTLKDSSDRSERSFSSAQSDELCNHHPLPSNLTLLLFSFGVYSLSRLFHSFWAKIISRWGENGRSPRLNTWPPAGRTWLATLDSLLPQPGLDPQRFRWRVIESAKD